MFSVVSFRKSLLNQNITQLSTVLISKYRDTQSCSKYSSPCLYSSLSVVIFKNLLTLFVCFVGSKNLMICSYFLGDELTLDGIGLADGADIFVWNGKEVKEPSTSFLVSSEEIRLCKVSWKSCAAFVVFHLPFNIKACA